MIQMMASASDAEVRAWAYGAMYRGLCAVLAFALFTVSWQLPTFAGSRGLRPAAPRLARMRKDLGAVRAFLSSPSLFWAVGAGDTAVVLVPLAGAAAAVAAGVLGGALAAPLMLLAYASYVTSCFALSQWFPWDSLAAEMAFLAVLLPAPLPLVGPGAGVALSGPPHAALAFWWRLLAWRLMFGFGRVKFSGTTAADSDYLKGFLVSMPLPNAPGILGSFLMPMLGHQLSLAFLFVSEVPLPFLFVCGWGAPRQLAALATVVLQLGIVATGSFGHFNVLTAVLALVGLDPTGGALEAFAPAGGVTAGTVALYAAMPFALLSAALNSWVNGGFANWPTLQRLPGIALLRAAKRFHVINSYGVFPPGSAPNARHVPVFEGSADGRTWHEYAYRFQTCQERRAPRHAAPYHPRFDFTMFYDSWDVVRNSLYHPLVCEDAYAYSPAARHGDLTEVVAQRLLQGGAPVADAFGQNPFPDPARPPRFVRAKFYLFRVARDPLKTGQWWERTFLAPHLPVTELDPTFFARLYPDPTRFHPDMVTWRARAPVVDRLAAAGNDGGFSAALVRAAPDLAPPDANDARLAGGELSAARVRHFWARYVPRLRAAAEGARDGWDAVPAAVAALRAEFSADELLSHERALAAFTAAMLRRWDASLAGAVVPDAHAADPYEWLRGDEGRAAFRLPLPSTFHCVFLAHRVALEGEAAANAALADPFGETVMGLAREVAAECEAAERASAGASGPGFVSSRAGVGLPSAVPWAASNYERVAQVARKLRVLNQINMWKGKPEPAISGFFRLTGFLALEARFPVLDGYRGDGDKESPEGRWGVERVPAWEHRHLEWVLTGVEEAPVFAAE